MTQNEKEDRKDAEWQMLQRDDNVGACVCEGVRQAPMDRQNTECGRIDGWWRGGVASETSSGRADWQLCFWQTSTTAVCCLTCVLKSVCGWNSDTRLYIELYEDCPSAVLLNSDWQLVSWMHSPNRTEQGSHSKLRNSNVTSIIKHSPTVGTKFVYKCHHCAEALNELPDRNLRETVDVLMQHSIILGTTQKPSFKLELQVRNSGKIHQARLHRHKHTTSQKYYGTHRGQWPLNYFLLYTVFVLWTL